MKTHITHVAIIYDGVIYSLPRPYRHPHVIRTIAMVNGVGIKGPDLQGFMTNEGNFVNRLEAMKIAQEANQLLGGRITEELFSEDVWAGKAPNEDRNYFFTLMASKRASGTEVDPDKTEELENE